jgi:hemolysin activation/secretion protein
MKRSVDPAERLQTAGHDRLLARSQVSFAAVGLTCLLTLCFAQAAELGAPRLETAQAVDQSSVLPIAPIPPETHGGPSPELPEVPPKPPPSPSITAPVPPPSEAAPPLRQGPRFVLRDVNIVGNTVLDETSIRNVVAPYLGKPVTTGDLEEIRRQFTLLYVNRGYINSGQSAGRSAVCALAGEPPINNSSAAS